MQMYLIISVFLWFHQISCFQTFIPFFLASFTILSKYSNLQENDKIVSIGNNEILPLMKWVKILDHDDLSLVALIVPTSMVLSFISSTSSVCISTDILLFGILVLEKILCFVPQRRFNCHSVVASSSTSTST